MSASLTHAAPVRFLIATAVVWVIGRGLTLVPWPAPVESRPEGVAAPRALPLASSVPMAADRPPILSPRIGPLAKPRSPAVREAAVVEFPPLLQPASYEPPLAYRQAAGEGEAASITDAPRMIRRRLSGSAWAFARGGGRASALAPGGQIGGGQAGVRLLYALDRKGALSASARFSGTLGGAAQTEASVGLDWHPLAALPVHLMLERRIAIDRGGRNAWTAGAAGGVYAVPLARHWRLDGYAEAGVVGSQRRDLYADGAIRVGRSVGFGQDRSLTLGAGLWGAAQPGAARLDVGPSAVLRLPVAGQSIALALDWRQRVAGSARPGSGTALTVATDF